MPDPHPPSTIDGAALITRVRVFVYRNLKNSTFTVRNVQGGPTTDLDEVWLADARFTVSQAGRLRGLREGRKTLHACVVGTLLDQPPPTGPRCDLRVDYHPAYETDFMTAEGRAVHEGPLVHMVAGRVYIPRDARWL